MTNALTNTQRNQRSRNKVYALRDAKQHGFTVISADVIARDEQGNVFIWTHEQGWDAL